MVPTIKKRCCGIFHCNPNQLKAFTTVDPFNTDNTVSGYICKRGGSFDGSLYITHVNGESTSNNKSNVIYGTPKLAYPYNGFGDFTWRSFPDPVQQYVLSNKWNGMNVLFFRYYDAAGTPFISAKSKGTPFLHNGSFGLFVNLTFAALGLIDINTAVSLDAPLRSLPDAPSSAPDHPAIGAVPDITVDLQRHPPPLLQRLATDLSLQSMTCELCGDREPHLVAYDFEIRLVPLFATDPSGRISPVLDPGAGGLAKDGHDPHGSGDDHNTCIMGPWDWERESVIQRCQHLQQEDRQRNEAFRRERGLSHRYEYRHFATEGRVLYPLDREGYVVDRTMYKVKPRDIEEVHWGSWDESMAARVDEAVDKMRQREREMTEEVLREELDMGPKEWGRYGSDVLFHVRYVRRVPGMAPEHDERIAVLVCGVDASVSTNELSRVAQKLGGNKGTLGMKHVLLGEKIKKESALQNVMKQHLRALRSVLVTNRADTVEQRETYVNTAKEMGLTERQIVRVGVGAHTDATETDNLDVAVVDSRDDTNMKKAKQCVREAAQRN
eukprot:gb/GECH01012495.1/.p1 GENE.gb/GECH01012495.1/~~gb/GECH01012495.1/.p1  ORF type:complete len:552 (+),score=109.91 gb/GECH01012495.1/:1-1656(+)